MYFLNPGYVEGIGAGDEIRTRTNSLEGYCASH